MTMRISPLILVGLGLFAVAFNIHLPDFGETYVSRNLLAWVALAGGVALLWWQPMRMGTVVWSYPLAFSLLMPVVGAFWVLALNIIGSFEGLHAGHLFLPGMLLGFALLVGGLMQHPLKQNDWAWFIVLSLAAFLSQYVPHFLHTHPLMGALAGMSPSISWPPLLTKSYAGFGQYNLFGSFLACLLLLGGWAATFLSMQRWMRLAILALVGFYALEFPVMHSKTGVLGMLIGLIFMAVHVARATDATLKTRRNFAVYLAVLAAAYGLVVGLQAVDFIKASAVTDWGGDSMSVRTRWTMWVIAWRSFLEAPLFGHGIGSYLSSYMTHYARYGIAENLTFHPVVTIPHNLVLHVLSEAGLFGAVVLLAPFAYLAYMILRFSAHRWLVMALVSPIMLHSQTEYPYIASGSHYFMLAIALVAGSQNTLVVRQIKFAPAKLRLIGYPAYMSIVAFCGGVAFIAISMSVTVYRSAIEFVASAPLPLAQYVEQRYQSAGVGHPVIGRRMRAMSDLRLAQKTLAEKNIGFLKHVAIPAFEENVVRFYAHAPVWDLSLQLYAEAGDVHRIEKLVQRTAYFDPERAAMYRHTLDEVVALTRLQE